MAGKGWQQEADRAAGKLGPHILNHKYKTKRVNWERQEDFNRQSLPPRMCFLQQGRTTSASPTELPTADQMSKCPRLWGSFLTQTTILCLIVLRQVFSWNWKLPVSQDPPVPAF